MESYQDSIFTDILDIKSVSSPLTAEVTSDVAGGTDVVPAPTGSEFPPAKITLIIRHNLVRGFWQLLVDLGTVRVVDCHGPSNTTSGVHRYEIAPDRETR